ncbi:MAG TPA: GNAT family N-acetyltransferase [Frankiaceae bacterium]|nr:GNAT family N-acetyltransferase [Frankiaceae bacterium]
MSADDPTGGTAGAPVKELQLPDGTPAMVWALSPNDARGLRENYRHLSPEARYSRFLTGVGDLSDEMLRRLVDEVDGVNHVALVLVVFPENGPDRAVGIGRIVRLRDDPAAADIAVTVDDAWRRHGIGAALLDELLRRRPAGVRELVTHVAADNKASLALLSHAGDVHLSASNGGRYDVRVTLTQSG